MLQTGRPTVILLAPLSCCAMSRPVPLPLCCATAAPHMPGCCLPSLSPSPPLAFKCTSRGTSSLLSPLLSCNELGVLCSAIATQPSSGESPARCALTMDMHSNGSMPPSSCSLSALCPRTPAVHRRFPFFPAPVNRAAEGTCRRFTTVRGSLALCLLSEHLHGATKPLILSSS
jgi:hypothetical protein